MLATSPRTGVRQHTGPCGASQKAGGGMTSYDLAYYLLASLPPKERQQTVESLRKASDGELPRVVELDLRERKTTPIRTFASARRQG